METNFIGNIPVDPSKIPDDSVLSTFSFLSDRQPSLYVPQQYAADQRIPHTHQQQSPQVQTQQVCQNPFFPHQSPIPMMDQNYAQSAPQTRMYEDPNYMMRCPIPTQQPSSGSIMNPLPSPSYSVGSLLPPPEAHSHQATPPMAMQNPHSNPNQMFYPGNTFAHSYPQRHATPPSPNYASSSNRSQGNGSGQNVYNYENRYPHNLINRMQSGMGGYNSANTVNVQSSVSSSPRNIPSHSMYENISPPGAAYAPHNTHPQQVPSRKTTPSLEIAHGHSPVTSTHLGPKPNNFPGNTPIHKSQAYSNASPKSSGNNISGFQMYELYRPQVSSDNQNQSRPIKIKHSHTGNVSAVSPSISVQSKTKLSDNLHTNHVLSTAKSAHDNPYVAHSMSNSKLIKEVSMPNRNQMINDNVLATLNTDFNARAVSEMNKTSNSTSLRSNAQSSSSYLARYSSPSVRGTAPVSSSVSNRGVGPMQRMAAPLPKDASSNRVANSTRGSYSGPTSLARGITHSNVNVGGSPAVRQPIPRQRGLPPTARGLPPPPPCRGAQSARRPPARGHPSVRGGPASIRGGPDSTRGSLASTRGSPVSTRGGSSTMMVNSISMPKGMSARGSATIRGTKNRGRGVGFSGKVTMDRNNSHSNESGPSQHEISDNYGVVNPIQWYRLPDPAPSSSYQSDIEAMRASVTEEQSRPISDSVQNWNRSSNQDQLLDHEMGDQNISVKEKEITKNAQERQCNSREVERAERIRIKQESMEVSSPKADTPVAIGRRLTQDLPSKDITNKDQIQERRPVDTISSIAVSTSSHVMAPKENLPVTSVFNVANSQQLNSDLNQKGQINTIDSSQAKPAESRLGNRDEVQDRKPVLSARDRVYSMWQAGQVVGRAPAKVKYKAKVQAASLAVQEKEQHTNKKAAGHKDKRVSDTDGPSAPDANSLNNNQTNNKSMFYVLFHGHKLLCFKYGHVNSVLVCQFQFECFPDKGKGSVSNCINKAFRIKKKVLEHPSMKDIIEFLKKNGYITCTWQDEDEPLHMISLDDARRVYHYIYKISECSFATCVVEVLNQEVDLNVTISPSKRKILTQEMKIRIKREKKQADDERYGKLYSQTKSNNGTEVDSMSVAKAVGKKTDPADSEQQGSDSNDSDYTMMYGQDEQDVVIVEGPANRYLLKWDGKNTQTGGVCNTIVGQVRYYRHEKENYLVVSDLCRILGTTEFMTGVETDNVILYACTKDILSFLNGINDDFPKLDTGLNCLVKEKDIGVHSSESENFSPANNVCPPSLKRPLCKQELMEDEVECSSSKQQCLDKMIITDNFLIEKMSGNVHENPKKQTHDSVNEMTDNEDTDFAQTKTVMPVAENGSKDKYIEDDSNIIICFDSKSVNAEGDKAYVNSSNIACNKNEMTKDQSDIVTIIPSPDSCVSTQSQDHPMSPAVLRQQKDISASSDKMCLVNSCIGTSSQVNEVPSSKVLVIDEAGTSNSKVTKENVITDNLSQTKSSAVVEAESPSKTSAASSSSKGKGKMIMATVIDINSVASRGKSNNSDIVGIQYAANASDDNQKQLVASSKSGLSQLANPVLFTRKDVDPFSSTKNATVLRKKYCEDDLELSKLHVTTVEGLEEYKSRGSLLKEMEVLRAKNRTLQETLKCLRDQLKKSKAESEKSGKLIQYYESVIQEITASFKDGDKVEEELKQQSLSDHPIVIDD